MTSVEDAREASTDPRKRVRLLKRLAARFAAPDGPPLVAGTATDGGTPLSFSQQQLWVLDRINPGKPTYNIVGSAFFRGPFRPEILTAAFNEIIKRHSALRATFRMQGSQPAQFIAPFSPYDVPIVDLTALPQPQRDAEVHRLANRGSTAPIQSRERPSGARSVPRTGRRPPCVPVDLSPHRHRRVVDVHLHRRTGAAIRRLTGRRAGDAAAARRPIHRFRHVAAQNGRG